MPSSCDSVHEVGVERRTRFLLIWILRLHPKLPSSPFRWCRGSGRRVRTETPNFATEIDSKRELAPYLPEGARPAYDRHHWRSLGPEALLLDQLLTIPISYLFLYQTPIASKIPRWMESTEHSNSRYHRQRLENIKHPLMRKRVTMDTQREFNNPIHASDLLQVSMRPGSANYKHKPESDPMKPKSPAALFSTHLVPSSSHSPVVQSVARTSEQWQQTTQR